MHCVSFKMFLGQFFFTQFFCAICRKFKLQSLLIAKQRKRKTKQNQKWFMDLGDGNAHQLIELLGDLWSIHANVEIRKRNMNRDRYKSWNHGKRQEFFVRKEANPNSVSNHHTTVGNIQCDASTKDATQYPKTAIWSQKSILFNQVHWSVRNLARWCVSDNIKDKQKRRTSTFLRCADERINEFNSIK